MPERLVDVLNERDTVLHVVPVETHAEAPESECVREALRTAAHLHLVPDSEMGGLHARPHVDRGGQLAPFADALQLRRDAAQREEDRIRTRAYHLWEQAGCPAGGSREFWDLACVIERRAVAS